MNKVLLVLSSNNFSYIEDPIEFNTIEEAKEYAQKNWAYRYRIFDKTTKKMLVDDIVEYKNLSK